MPIAQRNRRHLQTTARPPTQSSSAKGIPPRVAIKMFGRNLRTSAGCAASRPISPIVAEVITETLASSKMPRLRCIISTGEPCRRPISHANSGPNKASSSPSGVRTCEGRFPSLDDSLPLCNSASLRGKQNQLRQLRGGQPGEAATIVEPMQRPTGGRHPDRASPGRRPRSLRRSSTLPDTGTGRLDFTNFDPHGRYRPL